MVAYACKFQGLIFSYDLITSQMSSLNTTHTGDVNAVTWDNKNSSNIIYSGSDDCMIYVWDRRTFGQEVKPVSVLIGHQEGVAHVASQGDSLHLISNGKDQSMKYWDIRKAHEFAKINSMPPLNRQKDFDYRYMKYTMAQPKHAFDCSVRAFTGHSILATLIRCDFSPQATTGQKYVYTGSADSQVYIYELENPENVKKLTVGNKGAKETVLGATSPIRDVSWHPKYPLLIAASFSGNLLGWKYRVDRIKN